MAVRKPYAANIGIGAIAMMANPTTEENADAASAAPVPVPAASTAWRRSFSRSSSSRYRIMK